MADYPISNVPRRVQYVNSGVGPYAFTFAVLVQTDIAVYRGNTLLTLTTDYSVVINANGTGSITLVTAGTGVITIVGARAIQRSSDYTTGGDLFASTLNVDLDSQTIFSQQLAESINRTVAVPVTDASTLDMQLPTASSRANKIFGFTTSGQPTVSATTVAQLDAAVSSFINTTGNNASSIGYNPAGSGALQTTVQAKLRETVSVKDFGAVGDGIADDTVAIQNAINAASTTTGIVIFPVGTFKITAPLSIVGLKVSLIGAGQYSTTIKASGTLTKLINAVEADDTVTAPFLISNLTLDGSSTTTTGIDIKFRHSFTIDHLLITGVAYGITAESAYIAKYSYTRITATTTSLNFVGSCHASLIEKCTLVSFDTFGVVINNAALGDGNNAMQFLNTDIEYSAAGGGAVYVNAGSSSITFDTCYIGESIKSAIFTVVGGLVLIKGGLVKYGDTSSSVGFALGAGALVGVENARVESEGNLDLSGLIYAPATGSPASSGKIYLQNANLITAYAGNTFFTGDPLQYGPSQVVFASRYGRNYTVANTDCTVTAINPTSLELNQRGFTVATITGASPRASLYIALTNLTEVNRQFSNSNYFVVVYTSNVPVQVFVSNGSGQVAPTQTLGTMPASSGLLGAYATYVQFNYDAFNATYTTLEFVVSSAAVGNTFTLREVYFADQRMICTEPTLSTTQPTLNLYKC